MAIALGLVILALALLGWAGQAFAWLAPGPAMRLGLADDQGSVDPVIWADARGEAAWDALALWTLLPAGALLIAGNDAWAYFGLVGGGMYVYFAGRGVFSRVALLRRGVRIGTPSGVRAAFVFLSLWGLVGLAAIGAAAATLADQ